MSLGRKATLNTCYQIPLLGYGTWQAGPGEVGAGVFEALKAGYRHLDLAHIYRNQREVGEGLKKALKEIPGLRREDIFITSKLWNNYHKPEHVAMSLDICLKELGLQYLDLFLIHWPVAFEYRSDTELFPLDMTSTNPKKDVQIADSVSLVDTWRAMISLPQSKVKSVGVSNHTIEHIEALIKATGVVPAVNQVERHPLLQSNDLVKYCKEKGIHITAYSAFGNNMIGEPLLITRPEIKAIADRLSATPAQVLLAWSQVGGHSVIPKSVTPARIVENFKEINLPPEDIATINGLGKVPKRYNTPYAYYSPRWDINIFGDELEKGATHKVIL
ncbi:NADP-dependent glycerol dehydrogenase [Histoplasma capsulatum G186AR]|uniref:D-xylose reductase [NAD(P)H] n=2 Tax=Ajellomyces capsulatus TaxID=5037 RepID=C0NLJ3_AJECG|nr:NADP-dependent glycerol dehydrogenase [Histoplasma capsulatum G186AR]EEH07494.1 NADP-dependent glycerol dehydrogenase [Histoplasma capsulatum G186AR]KAG5304360.1 NADP-dependent glycerol dehydrogenase [Histoplasma capsulatum]QSS69958.1 NADP-dependent glycerol dehydrogenase [Histoplasma capsulatum G186AR]